MIKNIILDIGNVLVDFRYHALMQDLGLSEQAISVIEEKCIKNEYQHNKNEHGKNKRSCYI